MKLRTNHLHTVLVTGAISLLAVFALWWFNPAHIPHNFTGAWHALDVLLFALVSYIIWHPLGMTVLTWAISSHIKDEQHIKPKKGLRVAFITNFVPGSESIELLHKTLPAMVAAKYTHDTWLLDEGNDPEAQRLCEQYGVKYFTRADKAHYNTTDGKFAKNTKGGNHNSWYDSYGQDYEFVAQIDTDFVPHPDFLVKTLGHFKDPEVAFVGTPQIYGNTEDSIIARGAAEQTYSFYGPVLRGFYGMDMSLLIGANHVIRVAALKDVDYYTAHITEDLMTGMKLHANGWKSVYVPEALAVGEGPTTWRSFFNQQMRWAYGCIHILFFHSFKLFKTMSWRQKLYYFSLQQYYFTGLATALSTVALTLYFVAGLETSEAEMLPFLGFYLPAVAACIVMTFWLQRYNIRPAQEKGVLWAGMLVSAAAWPIFFLAFLSVLRGKHLTYEVTPKGKEQKASENSLRLFPLHLVIGALSLVCVLLALTTDRNAPIMVAWAVIGGVFALSAPFLQQIVDNIRLFREDTQRTAGRASEYYRFFEFQTKDKGLLPAAPSDDEKYSYADRRPYLLIAFSIVSFTGITISMVRLLTDNPLLWGLFSFVALTVVYFVISLIVNVKTKSFDLDAHKTLVTAWSPKKYPTVDVFLPIAGESIDVLRNTWHGIEEMADYYPGKVKVYCLDDGANDDAKALAKDFKFNYRVRPNRGEFKKAGNLRYGFNNSKSQFIAIFDADFRPRHDFLMELLPYMDANPKIGIVQSPQYFDVHSDQNWIERGAGAVQELFYRFAQVSRQDNDASICVGSNAIYRRRALNDTGGTALIEHSEDVHTGFNLRMHGWTIQYLPVILAKGLCPATMPAFFKQQYRWCTGSMSLLSSTKFWDAKLTARARMSYISGFMYYIHTGLSSFYTPIVPIILLVFMPEHILIVYSLFILPALLFTQFVYPMWHKSVYGIEAWSVRSVYGWAHLFAIIDVIRKRPMGWQATGAVKGRDSRYRNFRILQIIFNFIPACVWVGFALYDMTTHDMLNFVPILASGLLYLATTAKVTFYAGKHVSLSRQLFKKKSLLQEGAQA